MGKMIAQYASAQGTDPWTQTVKAKELILVSLIVEWQTV